MTKNDEKMKILKKSFEIFFAQDRFRINSKAFLIKMSVLKFFQKMVKNGQKWTFLKKKIWFFFSNRFRMFQNVFLTEKVDFEKNSRWQFFSVGTHTIQVIMVGALGGGGGIVCALDDNF